MINDAYMRDFHLVVLAHCVVSIEAQENEYALKQMEKVLKADIAPSTELGFDRLKTEPKKPKS